MRNKISSEKGMALIVTLLITAILVAVMGEIVYMVHTHAAFAETFRDNQRAAILAEGGVKLAAMGLSGTMKGKNYTYYSQEEANQVIPEGDGVLSIRIEDEQGKFYLNSIVFPNGETNTDNYSAFSRLLKEVGLNDELTDTLADWVDINDEPRPRGAETYDYYMRLPEPYAAKNAPLDSIGEIMLVKGYTPEAYRKLSPFVTVYTDGRTNINTAPKEVLMALSGDITGDMADKVMDYRSKNPFKDTAEIRKVSGFNTIGFSLQGKTSVKSSIFRVFSRAKVGTGVKEVEAVVDIQNGPKSPKILLWRER